MFFGVDRLTTNNYTVIGVQSHESCGKDEEVNDSGAQPRRQLIPSWGNSITKAYVPVDTECQYFVNKLKLPLPPAPPIPLSLTLEDVYLSISFQFLF